MPIYKKRNESSLVTAVGKYLQVLENNGAISFWSRQQAGKLPFQRNDKWQSIRLGREGVSDIWCIANRRNPKEIIKNYIDCSFFVMVWIECKLDNGKQSPSQVEFQRMVEKCRQYYWLIHDCDELEKKFKEIGVL